MVETSKSCAGVGKVVSEAVQGVASKIRKGWDEYPESEGGKGGQVRYGCCDATPADSPFVNRLKSDLANSYYWTGNICLDYVFFVANWHPILGLVFCHPNHPWSKLERLEMFLISLAITLVPSAAIGAYFDEDPRWLRSKHALIFAFVTVPDIVVGVVLYQLSIADTRCPNLCGKCLDLTKKCCIVQVAFAGAVSVAVAYVILSQKNVSWTNLFVPLVEGRLWSFLIWFPMWLVLPCQLGFLDLWCSERRAADKKAAKESEKAEAEQDQAQIVGQTAA
mmetsp:Transcript_28426/g.88406  ORF Transcript_28426/g.88406 Transcript_28426/m.88406 type:complete len:278 (-) Transcript_28426:140-973(-)